MEIEVDYEKDDPNCYVCPDPQIIGWTTYYELNWLYRNAQRMDSVVEVGVYAGKSLHALRAGCEGKVYGVDHFNGSPQPDPAKAIDPQTARNNVPGAEIIVADSVKAARGFKDKSVDMVFIDAAHTEQEVPRDVKAWLPKVKKLICGHDYHDPVVKSVVNKEFGDKVKVYGTIWYVEVSDEINTGHGQHPD